MLYYTCRLKKKEKTNKKQKLIIKKKKINCIAKKTIIIYNIKVN